MVSLSCSFALLASITAPPSSNSAPRSQRFPVTKRRALVVSPVVVKVLIVKRQLFEHLPQRRNCKSTEKFSSSSKLAKPEVIFGGIKVALSTPAGGICKSFHWSRAINAAPYAPIKPATSGRYTFTPAIFSKARNTASLLKVPP